MYIGRYDYRGSTVAITDDSGAVTATFEYDSYGKLINRTGESFVIFGYNGRDGVITDANGLLYMRARYYSPELRRFINADIVPGEISDSTSLNRYAYVNGNPVSNIDPLGLSFLLSLGLIALGAVIGGVVNAVTSIVEQKKENGKVDWKEVAVDAAWGALDGAISASPLGFVGKTIASGVISAGQSITDQYFDSDCKEEFDLSDVDYFEVGTSVVIDVGFSMLDVKKPNQNKELNKVVSSLDDRIARERRRANQRVAKKRIANASLVKSNAIRGTVTNMIIDPFKPKQAANYMVNSTINKVLFGENEKNYSRK